MKRVLIITYYWPPAGGPGVQRVLKFARYLPEYGWEPVILTVENGEYPARDETLLKEISTGLPVFRTGSRDPFTLYKKWTGRDREAIPVAVLAQKKPGLRHSLAAFIRMNFFIPDAKKGWIPFALREGRRIIEQYEPELIFSSSPPPTVHLIAKKLSRHSGIPWVADLRDPWSNIHYYQGRRSVLAQRLDAGLERRTLRKANAVTCVSRHFASLIDTDPNKTHIIPNGFDESDFTECKSISKQEAPFTISYVGGLNENRYYPGFFEGLRDFVREQELQHRDIRFVLAGQVQKDLLNKISVLLKDHITLDHRGYLSHADAISLMCASDLLLLFMEKASNYKGHIPGKLFEYIRSGTYVLGIGDKEGDVSRILGEERAGQLLDPGDDHRSVLRKLYIKWKKETLKGAAPGAAEKYSRKKLAQNLSEIFNGL